jgi:hypothetical protein
LLSVIGFLKSSSAAEVFERDAEEMLAVLWMPPEWQRKIVF